MRRGSTEQIVIQDGDEQITFHVRKAYGPRKRHQEAMVATGTWDAMTPEERKAALAETNRRAYELCKELTVRVEGWQDSSGQDTEFVWGDGYPLHEPTEYTLAESPDLGDWDELPGDVRDTLYKRILHIPEDAAGNPTEAETSTSST